VTIATAALPVGQTGYVARSQPDGHLWASMPSDTIGSRLRHYRRQKRLSQQALADLSGVSRQTIAEMERGAVTIPREPTNVRALADALEITMRELAEPTGWYDDTEDTDWIAGLRADKRLDDEGKALIERLVRLEIEQAERREPSPNRQEKTKRRAV